MKKTIFWDFDGVILDSMSDRDYGFEEIFKSFDKLHVKKLLEYHRVNGGLSRYVKIKYFFNSILNKNITEEEVLFYAKEFSKIMRKKLVNRNNLIKETVYFIKRNFNNYNFHIVSGSDQEELRFLCQELQLANFFLTIEGSPIPKKQLVSNILKTYNYLSNNCCLIGDSINDFEAAKANNIIFYGYNNLSLTKLDGKYLYTYKDFFF